MRVDVVICFFRSFRLWPFVAAGLARNQEHIANVILSADEEWLSTDKEAINIAAKAEGLTAPIIFVDHPRQGMQQAMCFNLGVAAATSEYIFQIDDDVVLAPNCIRALTFCAEPETMLTGRLHNSPRHDVSRQDLKAPRILKKDQRFISGEIRNNWVHVRDNFLFYRKEDYLAMGGHDESYQAGQEEGYGFIDYDFALRWFKKFGVGAYEMVEEAQGYHLCGDGSDNHIASPINELKFSLKLADYEVWWNANFTQPPEVEKLFAEYKLEGKEVP